MPLRAGETEGQTAEALFQPFRAGLKDARFGRLPGAFLTHHPQLQEENFIIGGASVYKQFLPFIDRLYFTRIHKSFDGDVFFPEIDFSLWNLVSKEKFPSDDVNDFAYTNEIYDRKSKTS